MKLIDQLPSNLDSSCNFIFDNKIEARYVSRQDDYFIVYLSSHDGCNKACRFCHLTQMGETNMNDASIEQFLLQAQTVIDFYSIQVKYNARVPANKVHFNFMARGEPLDNIVLVKEWEQLAFKLGDIATHAGIKEFKFNISTIMPKHILTAGIPFSHNQTYNPSIYYSLYSLNPVFRKKWLPKAEVPTKALEMLKEWQTTTNGNIVLHWCLIEGENDSVSDATEISNLVRLTRIKTKFNLVRYNPFSENKQGREPNEKIITQYFLLIKREMANSKDSRIIPRVGFDVSASCGMFMPPHYLA